MHSSTHGIFGHANFCLHALVLRTHPHSPGGMLVVSLDHLSKSPRRGEVSFVHIQCITWVTAPSEVFEHAC